MLSNTRVPVPAETALKVQFSMPPMPTMVGVGKVITMMKRVSEKMVHHVVEDAFDRVSQRLTRIDVMLDQQERRITALEERLGATPDDRA
jgi:DNA topoisomerase VI subunit B